MMKTFTPCFALAIAAVLAVKVAAQTEINWSTIDGGGHTFSTGGAFELGGTIGQPDAQVAPVMTGASFELTGGFWPVTQVCWCLGDMNGDGARNGLDVQKFVACVTSGGSCSCADVDAASGVNIDDVAVFVEALLNGTSCN